MQTHDGWLVRVTPDLEGLTPAHLSFLAAKAAGWGNGRITLTMRGNLQLRGFDEVAARRFSAEAAERGLGLANPERESRRRLLFMSPLAGLDPDCASDTLALAREVEAALIAPDLGWRPPRKIRGGCRWRGTRAERGVAGRSDAAPRAGRLGSSSRPDPA
ncbi:hypothetical protein [Asaia platycodi]|uniref:hypothetical protein n=1 Tax=Asaia platycodi TaxID=610243 RepID=UPI000AA7CCAF|nr:hypothetical protein [Asaia platycodi]